MGLLRHVLDESDEGFADDTSQSLKVKLREQFKIPENLEAAVQALTLTTDVTANVNFGVAIARLKRHLISSGYFGPGLAAVMAKYGGNSEIAQVTCRAGAVGGFVYLLGHAVESIQSSPTEEDVLQVKLSDSTNIRTKRVVGMEDDLPAESLANLDAPRNAARAYTISHSVSIISSPLKAFFTSTLDTGPVPAVSIVLVDNGREQAPVYLQLHSEETGECPAGQCKSSLSFPLPFPMMNNSIIEYLSTLAECLHVVDNQPLTT